MIRFRLAVVFSLLLVARALMADGDCRAFALVRDAAGLQLRPYALTDGQTMSFPSTEDSGTVDIILPPALGTSAGLVKLSEHRNHVLTCKNGTMSHDVRRPGESTTSLPALSTADLSGCDVRVSVVGADTRASFLIEAFAIPQADSGPVQNLFASVPIPLGPNDYLITTSTTRRRDGTTVKGSFPIEVDRHLFAEGTVPGGKKGWFIIDTGATQSVVVSALLPEGTKIDPTNMVEYSSAGKRILDYAPAGATGAIKGIAGHATLASLKFGDVLFDDVGAMVMEDLPAVFGRPVVGILGLDQLRRASALDIKLPRSGKGAGTMALGTAKSSAPGISFSIVNDHIMLPARIDKADAWLILDTGAPGVVLDDTTATRAGLSGKASSPVGGLDSQRAASSEAVIGRMRVGELDSENVACRIAHLTVLDQFRVPGQNLGLIGNDFLRRFERVTIDFLHRKVYFAQ